MKLQVTNSPNPPRCPWSVIHCSNHFCSASNKIRFKVKDIALGLILKVTFFWNSKMSAYWLAGCFVYLNPISRNISVIPWLYSVSALKKEKVFITHKVLVKSILIPKNCYHIVPNSSLEYSVSLVNGATSGKIHPGVAPLTKKPENSRYEIEPLLGHSKRICNIPGIAPKQNAFDEEI